MVGENILLTRKEVIQALKCDYTQLRIFLKQGMPHIGEGKSMMFDLKNCHQWFSGKLK